MTNYTWTITDLFTKTIDGKEGYVVNAIYNVFGTDGTYSALVEAGSVTFNTEDVGEFIPYEDLTEEKVLEWIKLALTESVVTSIEASIQGQIDSQINPPQVSVNTPLPW